MKGLIPPGKIVDDAPEWDYLDQEFDITSCEENQGRFKNKFLEKVCTGSSGECIMHMIVPTIFGTIASDHYRDRVARTQAQIACQFEEKETVMSVLLKQDYCGHSCVRCHQFIHFNKQRPYQVALRLIVYLTRDKKWRWDSIYGHYCAKCQSLWWMRLFIVQEEDLPRLTDMIARYGNECSSLEEIAVFYAQEACLELATVNSFKSVLRKIQDKNYLNILRAFFPANFCYHCLGKIKKKGGTICPGGCQVVHFCKTGTCLEEGMKYHKPCCDHIIRNKRLFELEHIICIDKDYIAHEL